MNPFQDVREFHEKFGVPALGAPGVPSYERVRLRFELVREEYNELLNAMGCYECGPGTSTWWVTDLDRVNLPETADAIADLIYVLVGTAHEFGIPLGHVWNAVHESNMAKVGGGTDAKGKIQKPPGWVAPDVAGILEAHGWRP